MELSSQRCFHSRSFLISLIAIQKPLPQRSLPRPPCLAFFVTHGRIFVLLNSSGVIIQIIGSLLGWLFPPLDCEVFRRRCLVCYAHLWLPFLRRICKVGSQETPIEKASEWEKRRLEGRSCRSQNLCRREPRTRGKSLGLCFGRRTHLECGRQSISEEGRIGAGGHWKCPRKGHVCWLSALSETYQVPLYYS